MHSNLVIKQQKTKPWYIGVGSLVVLLFTASYLTGRYLAINDLSETKQQLAAVELELAETKSALDSLNERLVMQAQSAQVDNLSNQELINSVKSLQQNNKKLVEELTFYRKIMAPERDKDGLVVDSIKLFNTDEENVFQIRTTLIQAGKQLQFLKGSILIKVSGELDGQAREFDIRELGTFKNSDFQFQFKYFQNIQGTIELPGGFIAKSINVSAQTKGLRKNQKTNLKVSWRPEESQ
ncbi:MAG: DUF6776 family protein [Kangiellaceae bacterium]|jgi:Family of unknown function (DUF6776)